MNFQELKKFIEKYSPEHYAIVLALPILLLIIGFLLWNVYLYAFGFTEDEILKAKFILSGISFIFITLLVWWIFKFILYILRKFVYIIFRLVKVFFHKTKLLKAFFDRFSNSSKKLLNSSISAMLTKNFLFLIFVVWFFIYVSFIFPILPIFLGGSQPRAISLIANSETMPVLNSLGVQKGTSANYQTENLCIVHENSRGVYILREERVLVLDKSLFQGFSSLPGTRVIIEQQCSDYAHAWFQQGFILGFYQLWINFSNLIRQLVGQPKKYFTVPQLIPNENP